MSPTNLDGVEWLAGTAGKRSGHRAGRPVSAGFSRVRRPASFGRAVNADIPNCSARKSGMLNIIEVLEGRWEMLER